MGRSRTSNRSRVLIKQAAIDIFSVRGYGSTSIREISDEAGVNSALISYHFKNKQGILESIMVDYFEQLFKNLKTCDMQSEEESGCLSYLMNAVESIIAYQCKNIQVSTIIQRELSVDSMLVREVMSTYIMRLKAYFATILEMGMELGEFRKDLDADMQIVHLMSSIFFPYFNPQIVREVFYIDPMSPEFLQKYLTYLSKIWASLLKNDENC